jgi:hypothetical protein
MVEGSGLRPQSVVFTRPGAHVHADEARFAWQGSCLNPNSLTPKP